MTSVPLTHEQRERLRELAETWGAEACLCSVCRDAVRPLSAGVLSLLARLEELEAALRELTGAVQREARFSLTPDRNFPMSLNVRTALAAALAVVGVEAGEADSGDDSCGSRPSGGES